MAVSHWKVEGVFTEKEHQAFNALCDALSNSAWATEEDIAVVMRFSEMLSPLPEIPALTLSGGALSEFGRHEAVEEYRLWMHPMDGEDFYLRDEDRSCLETTRSQLLEDRKQDGYMFYSKLELAQVEEVVAVVWDDEKERYREVVIDC